MKTIRIFISSPGDVQPERRIAYKVISELNSQFSKYLHIELLMWENFPLTAESTFQEGIDYFLKSDVIDYAIFILWSRMGTPLCKKFLRPDGSHYQSGTEYEFDMMMNLYKEKGWPKILTYVKQSEQTPTNLSNISELEEYLEQKERLHSFIQEHFRDEETNSNYAYLQFGENASFEHKFREHLKALIKPILGNVGDIKEWEGNPYIGLTSFEFEQSPVFYGRRQLVYDTASAMVDFQHPEIKKSLVVLGESGSGKSSFIKAGLLPFFCDSNATENKSYYITTPSAYGEQLRQGIIDILAEHYPFLEGHPFIEELRLSNPGDKNFKHLSYSIDQNSAKTLLLFIDQFEEVFTDSRINNEERKYIFALLKGIVSTNRIHLILSIRNDFYYFFARYEDLNWIKKNSIAVDMPIMDSSEIIEIVEEPAKKACLKWEVSDTGEGLNHRIVNDALVIRDLPLIEFALSELYKKRNENDELTFDAYTKIGGLNGAIAQYADNFYNQLSEEEKHALEDIFAYVITKSTVSDHSFVRKTAFQKDIETNDIRTALLKKLIDAHLFVSDKDRSGNPTVTIAHEVLLSSWNVASEWIKREEDFLARNTHYEESARYWSQHGKKQSDLFKERSKLFEAEYHHYKYRNRLSADVKHFLEAAFKSENRKGFSWRITVFVLFCISVFSAIYVRITNTPIDPNFKEWIGWEEWLSPGILCSLFAYIGLPLYSIITRLSGKPKYQSINLTLIVWTILCILLVISDIINGLDLFGWLIDMPFFIYWVDKFYTWKQRKSWKKRFTPQRFSDTFWIKTKSILISCFVVLFVICISIIYAGALDEKNTIMENRAETADKLFRGLDNIKGRLSISDQHYIDTLWINYLKTNFEEELTDTICDDHDLDFANCMINMKRPDFACKFLYPDNSWPHHLLFVKALHQWGRIDDASDAIEMYLLQNTAGQRFSYDEYGDYNTTNFIWTAEIAGRFDLAEEIYEQLSDSITIVDESPGSILNHGHIFLSQGNISAACHYYDKAIEITETIKFNLRQDMHTFSHFGVIADNYLQQICNHYGITFLPSFTSPDVDSVLNSDLYQKLNGQWETLYEGTTIQLYVDADHQLLRYYRYINGNLVNRFNSIVRFEKKNGTIYWDEFCTDNDSNSFGKITRIDDNMFELEVIENGNPKERGQKRIYTKIE